MLKNYFIVTWRSITRNKLYSAINIIGLATGMAACIVILVLLIACINFMNLSTARSAERGKEVGIRKSIGALRYQLGVQFLGETVLLSLIAIVIALRKILGASVKDVVFLLSKHFIGLVLMGNLIAWPLAWLALHRWIQSYAYRVAISWWVFVLAGMAALLIALATVSFLTIKAATDNPVKSLRTE
jgi:ABC-type antimicrobial peptide transport system permease subunit